VKGISATVLNVIHIISKPTALENDCLIQEYVLIMISLLVVHVPCLIDICLMAELDTWKGFQERY
jgi:hypothetical protein